MSKYLFKEIVLQKGGFLRGPFGGALKKEIFVKKGTDTYKVYEQGVVLNKNQNIGRYYITNEYFKSAMFRFEVKPKDFLVSCSGVNYGAIFQLKDNAEQGIINQALLRIRLDNSLVDDRFFNYYFEYFIVKRITNGTGDSTIPNFPPMDVIKNIIVDIPDIAIQKKIATVLCALNDKIELNNKVNAELEAMVKTLYDYWFVQFDFPGADGRPYKASGGKMVYNEQLKRDIPEGWEVSVFNDWVAKTKTGDWGKGEIEGSYSEHVYCVRGADINGLNGKGEVKAPERYILKNNLSKALQPNDFIIEISGGSPVQSTGRIALLTQSSFSRFGSKVICSNFCKAISLKDDIYVYNFLQEWQRLYNANVFFGFEGKTSGIKNFLYDSFMDTYHIVKPVENVAKKFHSYAQSLEDKKQSNLKQNKELASIRDWLLPLLMTGQVTVSDAYESVQGEFGMVAEGDEYYNKIVK